MVTNFPNAKRCWFITDIHFGVRSNLVEWIDIQEDYFLNWFIPLCEREYQPGDILMVGGDVFDSRNALNLRVLNLGMVVFQKLSNIFKDGVICILGNHDCYLKSSNDINSLKPLSFIPGVHLYEEPVSVKLAHTKWLLMPWRKNHEEEGKCVQEMGVGNDFLLCHADIAGMKFNKNVDVTHGCDISTYKQFKRVYSGHIHFAQKNANVNMLGAPYQLTRSDSGNAKGVTILDLSNDQETWIENTYSPKFLSYKFDSLLDMTPEEARARFKNNFVDLHVESKDMFKVPVSTFLSYVTGSYREVNFRPTQDNLIELNDKKLENFDSELSIPSLIKNYVDATGFESTEKDRLLNNLNYLHTQAEERKNKERMPDA